MTIQRKKQSISLMQYILLIHGTQVGIGVLSLPREVANTSGTDGWIAIVLGGLVTLLVSILIIQVMARHPDLVITEIFQIYFGRWLAKILTIFFLIYYAMTGVTILLAKTSIIRVSLLTHTPMYLILLLFIVPGFMIARHGVRVLGKYAVVIFVLFLWMPFVVIIPLGKFEYLYLLPILKEGVAPILGAIKTTFFSFLGFETAFFFYPYLRRKSSAIWGIIIANLISLAIYLVVTIVCFGYFSPDEIGQYTWPTISLFKVSELPFIERLDILFLSFYLILVTAAWMPFCYLAAYNSRNLMKKGREQAHLFLYFLAMPLLLLFWSPTFTQIKMIQSITGEIGIILAYIFPVCMWLYLLLHRFFVGGEKAYDS